MSDIPAPNHWIIVADSPFLPAHGGGEREHLGFVQTAMAEGLVAALIVPSDPDPASVGREDAIDEIRALVAPAPVFVTPRRRSVRAALDPRWPYVVASRPVPKELAERVRREVPEADAVVVFSFKSMAIGRALASLLDVPAVLRHHNLEGPYHRALAASAPWPRSLATSVEARRIDLLERQLERAPWVSGIADISRSDAEVRSARATVPVTYVPTFALGPDWTGPEVRRRPGAEPTVVFLGALDVSTNQDALRWFATEVWPTVLRAVPRARWLIVGRKPSDAVRQLVCSTPHAELHANVPSPAVYLSSATVAVNPAVSGSGVNIKVAEYLGAGVPVVSTTRGMQGLGLRAGDDIAVEDEPGAFAARVGELLVDSAAADRLGTAGQRKAQEMLDARASLRTLANLLRPVGGTA